jgi:hypothetical protein
MFHDEKGALQIFWGGGPDQLLDTGESGLVYHNCTYSQTAPNKRKQADQTRDAMKAKLTKNFVMFG